MCDHNDTIMTSLLYRLYIGQQYSSGCRSLSSFQGGIGSLRWDPRGSDSEIHTEILRSRRIKKYTAHYYTVQSVLPAVEYIIPCGIKKYNSKEFRNWYQKGIFPGHQTQKCSFLTLCPKKCSFFVIFCHDVAVFDCQVSRSSQASSGAFLIFLIYEKKRKNGDPPDPRSQGSFQSLFYILLISGHFILLICSSAHLLCHLQE